MNHDKPSFVKILDVALLPLRRYPPAAKNPVLIRARFQPMFSANKLLV